MASNEPKVIAKNKIFIVDPNPPGMEMHTPEDMFLYVKFSAMNRNRNTYLGDNEEGIGEFISSGTRGEINFIATQVAYDNDDNIILDETTQKQKTYATTSYTNIGGIRDSNSRGTLEGFGVKSIDIKYNASLVPTVDITFTDLRGSSLFDVVEHKDRKSPYSIFFKMPYPIFTLSVKGYFGKTVDYCLHMTNWTSLFDGTTGNFDISANFVGFQQAFLADMVLGNIIGAVNTSVGYNELMKIYDQEVGVTPIGSNVPFEEIQKGKSLNIRKLDDFFLRISKLQIEVEDIKTNSDTLESLNILNNQLSKLERIRTFIGGPMRKEVVSDNKEAKNPDDSFSFVGAMPPSFEADKPTPFEEKTNDPTHIVTYEIKSRMKRGTDYLSIRDFIIVNNLTKTALERYFTTLNGLIEDYRKFIEDASKETSEINKNDEFTFLKENYSITASSPQKEGQPPELTYQSFEYPTAGKGASKLNNVFNDFAGEGSPLKESYEENSKINPNANFPAGTLFKPQTQGSKQSRNDYLGNMNLQNNVLVLDFRKRRAKLQVKIENLRETIKKKRKEAENEINNELNKRLGDFSPKIKDVFRILCNNTDAMLQTLAQITANASNPNYKKARESVIVNGGYQTDIPKDNKNSYAWPSLYETRHNGVEEVYMGDIPDIPYDGTFPEFQFVDEVFNNLVERRKQMEDVSRIINPKKGGTDTDNWYPINPMDYKQNPYYSCNRLNKVNELKFELIKQLLTRSTVLKNYSRFTSATGSDDITQYAELEGINANKTIISPTIRSVVVQLLKDELAGKNLPNDPSMISLAIKRGLIDKKNGKYTLLTVDGELPEISGIEVSGHRNNEVDYLILDSKSSEIINNATSLLPEINLSSSYKKLTQKSNGDNKTEEGILYKSFFRNYNYETLFYYNIWNKTIGEDLLSTNLKWNNSDKSYPIRGDDNRDAIDIIQGPRFINKINAFSKKEGDTTDYTLNSGQLTESDFYNNQTIIESKALLLLSTLPFKDFENAILSVLRSGSDGYKGARITTIPSYYLYLIGGLLWRESLSGSDIIEWGDFPHLKTPKNCYLTRLGYLGTFGDPADKEIEKALTQLPTKTKNTLIDNFTTWAKFSQFTLFENEVKKYTQRISTTLNLTELGDSIQKAGKSLVNNYLNKLSNLIILAPNIFTTPNGLNEGLSISETEFRNFLRSFSSLFENTDATNTKGDPTPAEIKKGNDTEIKIKLQIYNYFKNINDKWVASSKGKSYNACGGLGKRNVDSDSGPNLIDYFKFLNRGFGDIGDKAVVNLNSLLTLGNNLDTNMYFFISKVLRDSNFLFQILPTFIDYNDIQEVKDMFRPITIVSDGNNNKGPVYTCIYIGSSSQSLDIGGEQGEYYYANDGFTFTEGGEPADLQLSENEDRENSLVAFRVAFGSENQTIFKNVSLNQQEHRETGEYFKALTDLVDKRGATQRSYQGTDLLRLFKTRSYTCKVEALGCMNIQPLMYFDLQNVPFFNGAYLITSVSHNISANHMTTSFTGLRQSKYMSSPVEDVTAFLNIDLDEGNNDPPVPFENLKFTSSLYNIGVKDFDKPFNVKELLTVKNLADIGITTYTQNNTEYPITSVEVGELKKLLFDYKIISNSQVTMFLSTAATNSKNFSQLEMPWNIEGDIEQYLVTDVNGDPITSDGKPPTTTNLLYNPTGNSSGTKQQQSLSGSFGNDKKGEGYRYKFRGFIYVVGKAQYNAFFNNNDNTLNKYWENPDTLSHKFVNAARASTVVWTTPPLSSTLKTDKSWNDMAQASGGAATFAGIIDGQSIHTPGIEDYFQTHEKVLSIFNLLEYGDPV